ncbi:Bug family tripartite tricarboxylate transporter substrate binding protein [Limnohabitans radicicola]|uniref:Tripartite tricarboxylate transporter substrate binding protein n=1 Tax=Limnohabitans radicicola TaxID=2771427 RepID=A0A927FEW6_9BURK|nr:tripartite tricarboxylate transporter substrate binding protein [Limnohabitans radicicola]MBD8050145.1 tripartite tricarboxylate transporter substrate binding protein [Limnohabitans radicicola]
MVSSRLRLLLLTCLVAPSLSVSAQTWPNKPIKVITSAAPGGIVDIYARRHQPHLQNELGQPVLVENKPGASGAMAGDAAAKSEPDGHTLFMGTQNELGLIGHLGVPVRYDPVKDFSVVGLAIAGYPILMVNAQLGVKTVAELVAYMKAKNATLDCGGSGTATIGHFVCAAFAVRTGTKIQYVPYKSNVPAMTDAASGQVQLVSAFYSEVAPFIGNGKLIPLGVFGASRLPLLPLVPTMAEQGLKDLELQSYTVYAVPAGTPVEAQRKLHAAIVKAANHPDVMDRVKSAGGVYFDMNLEETQSWQKRIQSRWNNIVQETGIKLEK